MNTDKLSQRLEAVTNYIPSGARVADIGSDHAYLPCYAVKKGIVPFAIAGEVVEGPFQSAKSQVEMEGLLDQIAVRKGNGLEVINSGEVDCITIAGMGGALIATILEEGKSKLDSVQRLVLQPNLSAISIRTWLIEHGWELIAEEILEEDGKIYEILAAEKGEPLKPYKNAEQGLLMGPFLIEEKSAVFQTKWQGELRNWERILMQLEKAADTEETEKRKQELKQKIKMVEEVLNQ
ncbi:tRNA (adenine(22)-N(1))-methyltransferase [Cytobacillus oceanisediminis]|uniref:tRNA (Adenine22-N1)-methyltransferase n=1 Tax=Cytobacillus oceanisediminis TaxID=665099 RepID=A0A562JD40_9BACI|nr:tRNA (adenine(22)-N(1))-methyltransferase TrmK [Cytobacillus oceanisediminis]TWH81072.1 tRNA (adenine22-N1)-methyltransferase [Cytobacillus oceanisediminis]